MSVLPQFPSWTACWVALLMYVCGCVSVSVLAFYPRLYTGLTITAGLLSSCVVCPTTLVKFVMISSQIWPEIHCFSMMGELLPAWFIVISALVYLCVVLGTHSLCQSCWGCQCHCIDTVQSETATNAGDQVWMIPHSCKSPTQATGCCPCSSLV